MPRSPGLEPPGEGGGAAERLRQFEEARGLRSEEIGSDEGEPDEEEPEEGERGERAGGPDEAGTEPRRRPDGDVPGLGNSDA